MTFNRWITIAALAMLTAAAGCQKQTATTESFDEMMVVEASCGQCQFGLAGDGCDLAVRVDGQAWLVDGTAIDDHGDAHAADGFCNAVRSARVTGAVEEDRFVATSFELIPDDSK